MTQVRKATKKSFALVSLIISGLFFILWLAASTVFSSDQTRHKWGISDLFKTHRAHADVGGTSGTSDGRGSTDTNDTDISPGERNAGSTNDTDGGCGGCGGCGGGCFVADTPVVMADGTTKPIKAITIGDEVTAFDKRGNLVPKKVIQFFEHPNREVVTLNNVQTTTVHRFLTRGGEYKRIGELETDDVLIAENGSDVPDWSVEKVDGLYTVYNFTVEDAHTYIAGGFRVHNAK